jgi:hypothetical protein
MRTHNLSRVLQTTGMVLGRHERWQFNTYLNPYLDSSGRLTGNNSGFDNKLKNMGQPQFPGLENMYVPILWMDNYGQVSEAAAAQLQTVLSIPSYANLLQWALVGACAFCVVIAAAFFLQARRTKSKHTMENREAAMSALMVGSLAQRETVKAMLLQEAFEEVPQRPSEQIEPSWASQHSPLSSLDDSATVHSESSGDVQSNAGPMLVRTVYQTSRNWLSWLRPGPARRTDTDIPAYNPNVGRYSHLVSTPNDIPASNNRSHIHNQRSVYGLELQ